MTKEDLLNDMRLHFLGEGIGKARKYVGGLLPAMADFFIELKVSDKGYSDLGKFYSDYPLITDGVSTLTVEMPGGGQKTIRPAYERHHRFYITENHRLDFPRSAPYATGKWRDYEYWLEAMLSMSREDLAWVVQESRSFVLQELKDQSFDPSSVNSTPPVFKILLESFDFNDRAKGEPTGAAFQAMVFGYIRADSPHLQVEARKARAGSSRTKGIGDIDAWDGNQLIISVEVKHYTVSEKSLSEFTHFSNSIQERGALGMVVAEGFSKGTREKIEEIGLIPLDTNDIIQVVRLWDPLKQHQAWNAFYWVVVHKEQKSGLISRVDEFWAENFHEDKNRSPLD